VSGTAAESTGDTRHNTETSERVKATCTFGKNVFRRVFSRLLGTVVTLSDGVERNLRMKLRSSGLRPPACSLRSGETAENVGCSEVEGLRVSYTSLVARRSCYIFQSVSRLRSMTSRTQAPTATTWRANRQTHTCTLYSPAVSLEPRRRSPRLRTNRQLSPHEIYNVY